MPNIIPSPILYIPLDHLIRGFVTIVNAARAQHQARALFPICSPSRSFPTDSSMWRCVAWTTLPTAYDSSCRKKAAQHNHLYRVRSAGIRAGSCIDFGSPEPKTVTKWRGKSVPFPSNVSAVCLCIICLLLLPRQVGISIHIRGVLSRIHTLYCVHWPGVANRSLVSKHYRHEEISRRTVLHSQDPSGIRGNFTG